MPKYGAERRPVSEAVGYMDTQVTLRKISRRPKGSVGTKVGDEVGRRGHGIG
jgi:hypothetical protein